MEYQKMINLLDNTPNHPSKFNTKNWVEINDDTHAKSAMIIEKHLGVYINFAEMPNNTVNSESPKFKPKSLNNTNNEDIIDAKITMPLKHLSNFCITLEMPLINCAINLF